MANVQDEITPVELSPNATALDTTTDSESKTYANGSGNNGGDATSVLRRTNAARTLQAVAQAVLSISGITGWEIMDVLAGGVGVSDAVFTVRQFVLALQCGVTLELPKRICGGSH
jgi:hypothetical protein